MQTLAAVAAAATAADVVVPVCFSATEVDAATVSASTYAIIRPAFDAVERWCWWWWRCDGDGGTAMAAAAAAAVGWRGKRMSIIVARSDLWWRCQLFDSVPYIDTKTSTDRCLLKLPKWLYGGLQRKSAAAISTLLSSICCRISASNAYFSNTLLDGWMDGWCAGPLEQWRRA